MTTSSERVSWTATCSVSSMHLTQSISLTANHNWEIASSLGREFLLVGRAVSGLNANLIDNISIGEEHPSHAWPVGVNGSLAGGRVWVKCALGGLEQVNLLGNLGRSGVPLEQGCSLLQTVSAVPGLLNKSRDLE